MKRLFFSFFLIPLLCFSQGEANNWYFGRHAGVSFNTTPPTVLVDGKLSTKEGCSSISDTNGNLLFYTDGRTIWDKNHQTMPNANYSDETGLLGDPSSTSSGLIVPHPTIPYLYFVFTVDEPHHDNAAAYPGQGPANQNGEPISGYTDGSGSVPEADDGYNNGLNYSVVDMRLRNGMGDVAQEKRNLHLITYDPDDPEEIKYKCSEKITAVKGADCESIWVLTHFINKFYAFKIDENGVDPDPVVSTLDLVIPIDAYRRAAIGYMKVSPNGKKIVLANNTKTFGQTRGSGEQDGGVYLFDFNDQTGKVTGGIPLIEQVKAYGVEFSMESTKVYATAIKNEDLSLYQWDLESPDVPASRFEFSGVSGSQATALQLAPNGKIYRSVYGSSKLAVINHPELSGAAAGYSEDIDNGAIFLKGKIARFGLPPFIQSIFTSRINIVGDSDEIKTKLHLCDGEKYLLKYENIPNASYTWYRNGTEILGETTSTLNISQPNGENLPYSERYKLVLDRRDGSCPFIGIAQVTYYPYPSAKDAMLERCLDYVTEKTTFDLYQAKSQLLNGLEESEHTVIFYPSVLSAQSGQGQISNPSGHENSTNPEILGVRVVHDKSGCYSVAKLKLSVESIDKIGEDRRLVYCKERFPEKIVLGTKIPENHLSEYTFFWEPNQQTSPTIQVNEPGTYRVTVTRNSGCSDTRSFEVVASNIASFSIERIDASENNSITIIVSDKSIGDYVHALDNKQGPYQESPVFAPVAAGIHTVYVKDKNGCGISEKEIGVVGIMKFFTPNNDNFNDHWHLLGTINGYQMLSEVYIYDRYGKLLKSGHGESFSWDGTYHGELMQSNDYWYRIVLEDGRVLRGNFSLIR